MHYQAKAFADLAGVTIRTLHHYDRLNLLRPKRRTLAGYRLYEARDLERLEQIVALKYLGLSLEQIRTVLNRDPVSLLEALSMQRRLLEEKRCVLTRAIHALGEAELQIKLPGVEATTVLGQLIRRLNMEGNEDWFTKYATEEGRVKMEARRQLWSPELQERISRQWSELIADVENSLGEDPASEQAQALAARWNALVEEFTGRDKDIEDSVANVWRDRKNWPSDVTQKSPSISPEVWAFIARANKENGSSARRD